MGGSSHRRGHGSLISYEFRYPGMGLCRGGGKPSLGEDRSRDLEGTRRVNLRNNRRVGIPFLPRWDSGKAGWVSCPPSRGV